MRADTIAALATAEGKGALAVIRISGPGAFAVCGSCTADPRRFNRAPERQISLYTIVDPESGAVIDNATAVRYCAPRSYTGEDMVEVFTHGGEMVPSLVLASLLKAGARQAEGGEFTRRAVLGGKMDILSAEAVGALIASGSLEEHGAAIESYRGYQRGYLETLTRRLEDLLARLEADIEFGEGQESSAQDLHEELRAIRDNIQTEVEAYRRGIGGRGERRIVIAGEPNAGKSTLFNALVGAERAIVHGTAGTTRDYVAQKASLGGDRVVFVDTAGFGLVDGDIVARSVERSWEQIEACELVVWVSSAETEGLTDGERRLIESATGGLTGVVSKSDLADGKAKAAAMKAAGVECVSVSLVEEAGRSEAIASVERASGVGDGEQAGRVAVLNARQEGVLLRMLEQADVFLGEPGGGEDAVAYAVNTMLQTLGEFSGVRAGGAILDEVFGRFCVGK